MEYPPKPIIIWEIDIKKTILEYAPRIKTKILAVKFTKNANVSDS